jgi:hypothetical protein
MSGLFRSGCGKFGGKRGPADEFGSVRRRGVILNPFIATQGLQRLSGFVNHLPFKLR